MKGIIIAGGVGPLAGVALHKKIIENTKTAGSDQDHIDVIHLSFSSRIGDRTAYLLEDGKINPAEQMASLVLSASEMFAKNGMDSVVGVPCNTFHAEEIFGRFKERLSSCSRRITVVNMIDETVLWIRENMRGVKEIGLLSTTGTRKTGLYLNALKKSGYSLVEVDESEQWSVHDIIYNREWGIKAKTPVSEIAVRLSGEYADKLVKKGAGGVILGCTEFPLALVSESFSGVPLIDPVKVLARGLVREVSEEKLVKS